MADDDKKRTQEASETDFTTRGGRQEGPSAREAFEAPGGRCNPLTKGGGVLAYIDALFWLAETTQKATR